MAAAVAKSSIANGDGPAYVLCALPYRTNTEREDWGLDTALAIVEEAVEAFDPPRMQTRPARTNWPPELQDKAKPLDTLELMRSAYFGSASSSLPDLSEPVPKIEVNFYMWLSCRKQQWRQHRINKRTNRQLTPEEDFPGWLKQRKLLWKSSKMERESLNTPRLEDDFYTWLAERKKVWRLQRLTRKHVGGRELLSTNNRSTLGRDSMEGFPDYYNYQDILQQQQQQKQQQQQRRQQQQQQQEQQQQQLQLQQQQAQQQKQQYHQPQHPQHQHQQYQQQQHEHQLQQLQQQQQQHQQW